MPSVRIQSVNNSKIQFTENDFSSHGAHPPKLHPLSVYVFRRHPSTIFPPVQLKGRLTVNLSIFPVISGINDN